MLGTLLQASFEAAVVAAGVFVLCRALPGLPARVRVWMWWLVCAKLLVGVLPVPSVPLAVVPVRAALWSDGPALTAVRLPSTAAPTRPRAESPRAEWPRAEWPLAGPAAGRVQRHGPHARLGLGRRTGPDPPLVLPPRPGR